MIEAPQYLLAITVVGVGLIVVVFFLWEAIVTSNIYQQGVKLYQQQDYKAAEESFRRVISRHPSNDAVRLLLGETLMQQERLEDAEAVFKELSHRAPKNVDAYFKLGMALVKQDRLKEAIAPLERARDLFTKQRQSQQAETIEQLLQKISTQQGLT